MKRGLIYILLIFIIIGLFLLILLTGSVEITIKEIIDIVSKPLEESSTKSIIFWESRFPMAVTALLAGAGLSVAGLLLQTVFRNPLAGPSILGISSGASLGVGVVMLCGGLLYSATGVSTTGCLSVVGGALIGSLLFISILLFFSGLLKSGMALLIVGIMLSYLGSSLITLMDYFAPADNLKSFVVWGMGSYSATTIDMLPFFGLLLLSSLLVTIPLIKPLDALLLSERYAENMGYNIRRLRTMLLIAAGLLTSIVTAFCGPIGFIGLIVPHIARMIFNTSRHAIIIPATLLIGCTISLLCGWICSCFSKNGVLPINVITPIIGIPVIFYILLFRKRIKYFN